MIRMFLSGQRYSWQIWIYKCMFSFDRCYLILGSSENINTVLFFPIFRKIQERKEFLNSNKLLLIQLKKLRIPTMIEQNIGSRWKTLLIQFIPYNRSFLQRTSQYRFFFSICKITLYYSPHDDWSSRHHSPSVVALVSCVVSLSAV